MYLSGRIDIVMDVTRAITFDVPESATLWPTTQLNSVHLVSPESSRYACHSLRFYGRYRNRVVVHVSGSFLLYNSAKMRIEHKKNKNQRSSRLQLIVSLNPKIHIYTLLPTSRKSHWKR